MRQPPANDNGYPTVIPVFTALLCRHDLQRLDVLVYGFVAAALARGQQPSVADIGAAVCVRKRDDVRERLQRLEAAGLLRRSIVRGRGIRARYELLGPKAA